MFKLLKLLSMNGAASNIVVATLLSMICWIVLPHIHIGANYPFQSDFMRFACIAFIYVLTIIKIIIGFFMQYKLGSLDQIKKIANLSKLKAVTSASALKSKCIDVIGYAHDLLRKDPGPRLFKKLPIYLVIGSEHSGKKTFVENAGLRLLPASYFGMKATTLIEEHPHYRFYFTDQGVYIVSSDAYVHDNKSFSKLLKYLKKRRSYKPLSGLILLMSISELMLAKHDDRRHFIQNVTELVQSMYRYLHTSIALYSVFTKCDLVHGFSEFFNHLSKDELMQLWGITFPLSISNNLHNVDSYFQVSFDQLIDRLDAQLAKILDIEKNQDKQRLIYVFPQQMQLFKRPLQGFVNELFSGLNNHKILQMRGIYFVSASQNGEAYDFIAHAVNTQFDLESPRKKSVIEAHESYFIYKLFQDVILKECEYVGYSLRMRKYRKWLYRLFIFGVPSFVIATIIAFHNVYKNTVETKNQIDNNLDFYDQAFKNLDIHNFDANQAFTLLNPLLRSENLVKNENMINGIFYSNDSNLNSISHALNRTLTSQLMPRVAASLESTLSLNQLDTNTLYATLKGYLAFSPKADTEASSMIAPMMLLWEKKYPPDSPSLVRMKYYLDRSQGLDIIALPIDRLLVNRVRLALQQVVPSDRAFALLTIKSMASDLPDIVLNSLAGQSFSSVFSIAERDDSVPALYTAVGFKRIFLDNINTIAKQVSEDNKEIGLQSSSDRTESLQFIIQDNESKYNSNYQSQWVSLLQHLQIKPFNTIAQANEVFQILSDSDSPFDRLMHIISDNTADIESDHIHVNTYFKPINQFTDASLSSSSLHSVDNAFNSIQSLLNKMVQSANSPQTALDYIQSFPKLNEDDPFKQLAHLAQNAPAPVQQWLLDLSGQAWQSITHEALIALNQKWNDQVAEYYMQHLSSHYPIDKSSDRDLSIDNFSEFYKPGGLYDVFYKQYIQSYIDSTNDNAIVLKSYDGYTLSLTHDELKFFEKSNHIVKDYFSTGGNAQITFSLKPMSLDKNASQFNFLIGDKSFNYAHGPMEASHYQWPFDLNQSSADLSVTGFSNDPNHLNAEGVWAIFNIFSHAQINKTKDGYLMEYRLGDLNFSWLCETDTPERALNLQDLTSLNFPNTLSLR